MKYHKCPHCSQPLPSSHPLVAATVNRPASVSTRHEAASRNEMATAIMAANAEDVIDPRSACPLPPRAVGFVEVKGEEPERFDEFTGPMGGGL